MTTEEVADILDITAKLMELHEENPFKVKALAATAFKLSKTRINLHGKSKEELEQIDGIGKSTSSKILELLEQGTLREFEELREKTPEGVIDMMGVKGLGPKKVRQLWKELQLESVGELLYACNENRLVDLKGFGTKTQESVKQNIEFKLSSSDKLHFATVETIAEDNLAELLKKNKNSRISFGGAYRRRSEIIDKLEIITDTPALVGFEELIWPLPVEVKTVSQKEYHYHLFSSTGSDEHLNQSGFVNLSETEFDSESQIYSRLQLPYIEPELREGLFEIQRAKENKIPKLIEYTDLKGILHNHTTYSDGMHTLREMAEHCKKGGFQYLGICDHSQSAFYANGLKADRILEQQKEIDQLNLELAPFKIFKGIESDILNDGSLDYPEEILKTFDLVVASVHSNLKMTEEKATQRLLKAIENPYTTILGHPTGRLLLARPGYPINHKKIIDACAANGVVIELNAHPYRLDIDWRWIPYCLEKGVKVSVNPDAHHIEGFNDMRYGVFAARKGMLDSANCFNALSLEQVTEHFSKRKNKRSGTNF
jgi:DNA polymerase (family 10)